jgi:hypothetical protein
MRSEDFFILKNPTASAGFEPANLGTKGRCQVGLCLIINLLYKMAATFSNCPVIRTESCEFCGQKALKHLM